MKHMTHSSLEFWGILADLLFASLEKIPRARATKSRPNKSGSVMRPGEDTPLWNIMIAEANKELRRYGAKAKLARTLGIPRQRLNDFLQARARLPNAEIALRLMGWICEQRAQNKPQ